MDDQDFDLEITPVNRIVPLNLRELWEFRDLIIFMIGREIKGRYRQTAFGHFWMLFDPIINMVLFTIVFGYVAKLPSDDIPYPLFNYSALLPWNYFGCCVSAGSGSLINNRHLISKVYFPRLAMPLVGVLTGLVDLIVSMVILFGMAVFYGYYPTWNILYVPVLLVMMMIVGLSVGLWFAPWIVHFHDVGTILGYGMRLWMYATPVVYASALIPQKWHTLYYMNPMANIIDAFRWAILGVGESPGLRLWLCVLMMVPFLIGGAYYFRRAEKNIVDIA
ncbi:MAG: ABC transporter permease [Spartobacteria bacterium]|nr:ABC transporter permease [Spartobacteria bacterium]